METLFIEIFQETSGFDIVIGNPPYIGEKEIVKFQIRKSNCLKFYQRNGLLLLFFSFRIDT